MEQLRRWEEYNVASFKNILNIILKLSDVYTSLIDELRFLLVKLKVTLALYNFIFITWGLYIPK